MQSWAVRTGPATWRPASVCPVPAEPCHSPWGTSVQLCSRPCPGHTAPLGSGCALSMSRHAVRVCGHPVDAPLRRCPAALLPVLAGRLRGLRKRQVVFGAHRLPPAHAKQPLKPAVGPRLQVPGRGFLGKVVDLRRRNQIFFHGQEVAAGARDWPQPLHPTLAASCPRSLGAAPWSWAPREPPRALPPLSPFTPAGACRELLTRPSRHMPTRCPLPVPHPHLPAWGQKDHCRVQDAPCSPHPAHPTPSPLPSLCSPLPALCPLPQCG